MYYFNSKYISTSHFPGFMWPLAWYYILTWLCLLTFHACGTLFCSVFNVCIYFIQHTYSPAEDLVFYMPMRLLCNCSRICFCNRKGISSLLNLMAIPSIIATLLLIRKWCLFLCSYSSFCVGSNVLCMILASDSRHHHMLPPLCLLWMSTLSYLLLY